MAAKKAGPLSHSSAKTLLGCEQKYVHYKVIGTERDPDYEKSDALAIGSAFHYILEVTRHTKPESMSDLLDHCEKDPDILLQSEHRLLVWAMVLKYLRLHRRMSFKVLEIEFMIRTDEVIGYVDALMEDPNGLWWIVDLKTAKNLYMPSVPSLNLDPQLNLYAAHAEMIAEMFSLDLNRFGGCRWRVTTKASLKRKDEDDATYLKRLINAVKSHDIEVPIERMDPSDTLKRHVELYKRSKALFNAKGKAKKNFGNCMSFFRPCEYWSRCHGQVYSDTEMEIVTEA